MGRDEAFVRLASALDDAARGRARSMLLAAPAGVGVTRLLDEATRPSGRLTEPFTMLRPRPGRRHDEPYGPLIRALGPRSRPCRRVLAQRRPATAEMARLLPIAPRLDTTASTVSRADVTPPSDARSGSWRAILATLGRLGERPPVLLLLEDLQRADPRPATWSRSWPASPPISAWPSSLSTSPMS